MQRDRTPRSRATRWLVVLGMAASLRGLAVEAKPPTLTTLDPAGARQGTTVRVKLTGSIDPWPPRFWTDGRGLTVVPTEDKGYVWATVASDAEMGVHYLRVANDDGASTVRPFVIGSIPEVREVEPNDDPARPQVLPRTIVTINGRLARNGDVDGFAVPLKKGEVLVASLDAARGPASPMDGLLQVARPDGIVLAENDDDHERDPQVVFRAPADGLYVVRTFAFPATPDSRIGFSGGDAYLYRLTLTTGPFADHAVPLAVTRGQPGKVQVEGWNLGEPKPQVAVAGNPRPGTPAVSTLPVPGAANPVSLRWVDHPVATEVEPNPTDHPQPITPPVSITGRIESNTDLDVYEVRVKKGEKLQVRVESRSLGQPLDASLTILDAQGARLSESDDANNAPDPSLNFTAPADGTYRLVVRDLEREGGPRAVYLLTVTPPESDLLLRVGGERFETTLKKPLSIPITITRPSGDARAIEITAVDLPPGVTAKPVVSEPTGSTSRKVNLELVPDPSAKPVSGPFRVVGRIKGGTAGAEIPGLAVRDEIKGDTTDLWLTVTRGK
ncbi:MAG: PPC domain-containing protein [Isosphaeraceae bacterium]